MPLLLDWGSSWRYLVVAESDADPAYADPDLDDSGWSVGRAAFGNPFSPLPDPSWVTWNTVVPLNAGIWLRAHLPAATSIDLRLDSLATVYWNGAAVWSRTGPVIPPLPEGLPGTPGVLAIFAQRLVRAGLDGHYIDAQVFGAPSPVRQYPRDDGLGHSSAARKFPPVKARRVMGGYT